MKVSDYIVSFFAEKGITDVFGYPGGMVTHLMDSFSRNPDISAHVCYHEQGAAFCACGYGQIAHLPGVAYATSGPGATNLVTGIANAYFDSIPCFFLTGQVNTYESKAGLPLRQKGFQETDIIAIVSSITKYAYQIVNAEDIRFCLEKMFHEAVSGRQGPVLLDIPMDIQRQDIDVEKLRKYSCEVKAETVDLSFVLRAIEHAERPCLLAGSGIRNAGQTASFRRLAEKLGIPVITSMIAVDVIPQDAPFSYGFLGAYGQRSANFILSKCDLIIAMGTRLDLRQIGSSREEFAPRAKLIRFDIDTDELSCKVKPDERQITLPLDAAISLLNAQAYDCRTEKLTDWIRVCDHIVSRLQGLDTQRPNQLMAAISRLVPDDLVITVDVGQNQIWAAQSFLLKEKQTMLFSGGHGAMGYSLPAAIGAYYASNKPVVSFNGDGGIQMNIQELQFISRENIPVKIVIFNNRALGMIRHFQEMYFDSNFTQTVADHGYTVPSFQRIADAYRIPYYRIETADEVLEEMFTGRGAALIEVAINENTYVFPKHAMGKPMQDQDPLLDRVLYDELDAL